MERTDAIVAAVKAGDVARMEAMIAEDQSLLHTKTPEGSLVLTAVYSGQREVTQALLGFNPPLDIFEAAAAGSAERISTLLAQSPQLVHEANDDGFEPLHLAAFFGRTDAVQALLARGAAINQVMNSKLPYVPSNTPLHAAIAGGPHREVVELLVQKGADVNALDSNGQTPLHSAAFHEDTDLIAYFLEHHAEVNRHGEGAPTPLAYALQKDKGAAATALRAAGGLA